MPQKLPQIYAVIAYNCIRKVAWFAVHICGNIWNALYLFIIFVYTWKSINRHKRLLSVRSLLWKQSYYYFLYVLCAQRPYGGFVMIYNFDEIWWTLKVLRAPSREIFCGLIVHMYTLWSFLRSNNVWLGLGEKKSLRHLNIKVWGQLIFKNGGGKPSL